MRLSSSYCCTGPAVLVTFSVTTGRKRGEEHSFAFLIYQKILWTRGEERDCINKTVKSPEKDEAIKQVQVTRYST
jgi:hypothetical protein